MQAPSLLLSTHQKSLPGILGGLGPLAHIEFERRLLEQSLKRGARYDQCHPVWLLVNASATPDRTKSLQGLVADCTPWLLNYAHQLEHMGAHFLIVTCNTAHAFHGAIQPQLSIPWIHMMRAVSRFIAQKHPTAHRIGVMATTGTLQADLYTRSLQRVGLDPLIPDVDANVQSQIMESIYAPIWGIKASGSSVFPQALQTLRESVNWFEKAGADLIIAGCTELSVGLARMENLALPWIDPLEIMADITVGVALGEVLLQPSGSFSAKSTSASTLTQDSESNSDVALGI